MSRTTATVRTADVARLYKAAKAAGVDPERVEIEARPDGTLVMRANRAPAAGGPDNPWDMEFEGK